MKKFIAPIIFALLIVSLLALVTKFLIMPEVGEYIKYEANRLNEADKKFKAIQLAHNSTPVGRFNDQGEISEDKLNKTAKELEELVTGGQLTFDNPEIHTLIEELRRRLEQVQLREDRVDQIERELDLQWGDLASITNRIDLAREELSKKIKEAQTQIRTDEQNRLKRSAAMLTNMTPANAVVSLRQYTNVIECAKLLYFMQVAEQANIISELNQGTEADKKMAGNILREFKKIGEEISLPKTE